MSFTSAFQQELNRLAAELIARHGAKSAFLGYRGFPGQICVSINEEVVHGVPGARQVRAGDLVSLDVGVLLDGFYGDMATTVVVGEVDAAATRLVEATRRALAAGIGQARAGNRLSDISAAIEAQAVAAGVAVVRDFVGHGIGRALHEEPQIPNFGPPGQGPVLRAGMTLAIEPMFNLGVPQVEILGDQWTVVTADRKVSAHFEHTVLVGEDAAEIITRAD